LTLDELCEAIVIDAETGRLNEDERLCSPLDILELCGSLIHVSDRGHITLAHLSVRDYLLSTTIRQDENLSKYSLEPQSGRHELAAKCLTYLQLTEMTYGPCKSAESYKSRLDMMPLLQHVGKAWPYYLTNSDVSDGLEESVLNFFGAEQRPAFLSWVQVLNADHAFKWNLYPQHATPLYYAASFGLTRLVERLAKNKSELDAPGSRFGGTALHAAILRNHLEAALILLQRGADPNKADWDNVSPLHSAAIYDNTQAIILLLEHGASREVQNQDGETPYDWAVKGGHLRAQRLLLGCVDLQEHQSTNDGETKAIEVSTHPTTNYYPNWYDARSGTESSIVVRVEVGAEVYEFEAS
jgi:hypothetical protein